MRRAGPEWSTPHTLPGVDPGIRYVDAHDRFHTGAGCLAGGVGVGRGGRRPARRRPRGAGPHPVRAGREEAVARGAADPRPGHRRGGRAARAAGRRPGRAQLLGRAGRAGGRADRRPAAPSGVRRLQPAGGRGVVPRRLPQRSHPCRSRRTGGSVAAPSGGGLRAPGPHGRADRPSHRRGHAAPRRHADRTRRAGASAGRAAGDLRQVRPGRP